MSHLRVNGTFNLIGAIPGDLHGSLVKAVASVPETCFFDDAGKPLKTEVSGVDKAIASTLRELKWSFHQNYCPVLDCDFNVDLAIPTQKVLLEIEKGKQPRLELDIFKVASACLQHPEQWQYGALIVPSSYIELSLAGRQSPYQYLQRLAPLINPVLATSSVKGFLVIGYDDPRAQRR